MVYKNTLNFIVLLHIFHLKRELVNCTIVIIKEAGINISHSFLKNVDYASPLN